ncbi:MAG: hypothetical protein LW857_00595 [Verrucomicrobiae bacterium]|nr:hypothetical protein [Verrucomicrobiae bacterium]
MRLLVVKFSGLRGALATTAAFRSLKERHPGAAVTVVTTPGSEPGLEGCPIVAEIVAFDPRSSAWEVWALLSHLRRQRFDVAVALGVDALSRRFVAWSGAAKRACAGRPAWALYPWFHQVVPRSPRAMVCRLAHGGTRIARGASSLCGDPPWSLA